MGWNEAAILSIVDERSNKKGYWLNELDSLGIEPKRHNDLNDKEELEALADIIKQVYYQDYKAAYQGIKDTNNSFLD